MLLKKGNSCLINTLFPPFLPCSCSFDGPGLPVGWRRGESGEKFEPML